MMGHFLWLRCDLTVKTLSLSSNFLLTKKGGLLDLRGTWTIKNELWACKSALSSPSHFYYPIECINTTTCYKTRPKRSPSLDKYWKKKQRLPQMANDVKKVRQAGSYEFTQINLLFFLIKQKRALVDPYGQDI